MYEKNGNILLSLNYLLNLCIVKLLNLDIMRKKYGDFWDKQRLIDACLELCKDDWCFVAFPKIEEKMFTTEKIQAERINAVLKTHNIDYD